MVMTETEDPTDGATRYELSTKVRQARYFFRPGKADGAADETGEAGALRVIYGGMEECVAGYRIDRATFPFLTVEFVAGGRGTLELNGEATVLRPGSVFVYAPGVHVQIASDGQQPLVKYFLCLAGGAATRLAREVNLAPGTTKFLTQPFVVRRIWDELIDEGRSLRPAAHTLCRGWAELLLRKMGDLSGTAPGARGSAEQTFLRCRHLIEENARQLDSLSAIARLAGVETAHLCRLFKRFQGESPYRFLLQQKMVLAAEQMVREGCLVKEAGLAVGMEDPYHFSRVFKQVHHLSPTEFRRALRRD